MRGILTASLLLGILLSTDVYAEDSQQPLISYNDARHLVLASLPSSSRHLPKLGIDVQIDTQYPRFYIASVTWAGAPNGSVVVGSYEVDRYTGDVWDAVQECHEESTPALHRLQAKIREQIGMSSSDYQKVKKKGPMCQ